MYKISLKYFWRTYFEFELRAALIVFNLIKQVSMRVRNKRVKIEKKMCGNITTRSAIPRKRNHFKLHAVL